MFNRQKELQRNLGLYLIHFRGSGSDIAVLKVFYLYILDLVSAQIYCCWILTQGEGRHKYGMKEERNSEMLDWT